MALVCPVGHPDGPGQSFCPLCGRTKMTVADEVAEQLVEPVVIPELHPDAGAETADDLESAMAAQSQPDLTSGIPAAGGADSSSRGPGLLQLEHVQQVPRVGAPPQALPLGRELTELSALCDVSGFGASSPDLTSSPMAVVPQQPSDLHLEPAGLDLLLAGPSDPAHDAASPGRHQADLPHHLQVDHLEASPDAGETSDLSAADGATERVTRPRPFAGVGAALAARPVAGAAVSFLSGAVLAGAAVHVLA